jgi:quercetin dioxygenase-like cupin family protein
MSNEIQPSALGRDEGQAVWFLNTLSIVKATAESTRGAFGLIDTVIPAGFASPYHRHHAEDETFYITEGEVTYICDGKKLTAGPGAYIFGPRGIPHGFRVEGPSPARMLLLATPGGFERFIIEVGEPAIELALPQPKPPDMAKLMALAAKFQIDILGPLPA